MARKKALEDGRVARARTRREIRRAQILEAAARVFARKGYEPGSIADILSEAGIARGTFYLHFQSKKEVFDELLDALLVELGDAMVAVDLSSEVPIFVQLSENLAKVIDVLMKRVAVTRILLTGAPRGEVEVRVQQFYEQCLDFIRGSLLKGRSLGLVREIDVDIASWSILGGLKETVARLLLRRGLGALDRRALAQQLLEYHLHGALERPGAGAQPEGAARFTVLRKNEQ